MLQPHYGLGMHQAAVLLLVPDRFWSFKVSNKSI